MASTSDVAWARPPDFSQLNSYGWSWDGAFSVDENYLDLACLIARNSTAKDGHMGCALVQGVQTGSGATVRSDSPGEVVLCTINSSLFGAHRSDCHAEANAVSACAACGVAVRGLSCYVTRSPCVACYKLLASSGISRIVSPQNLDSPDCCASAIAIGIEVVVLRDSDARSDRRLALGHSNEDMERVKALREERKRLRKEKGFGKKAIRGSANATAGGEKEVKSEEAEEEAAEAAEAAQPGQPPMWVLDT